MPTTRAAEPEAILAAVAKHYGVSVAELLGTSRERRVAHPRHVAMYLLVTDAHLSQTGTGRLMGGRHHTSVLHGVRETQRRLSRGELSDDTLEATRSGYRSADQRIATHVFQPGDRFEPWCHAVVGERLVKIADQPMGATYQQVPALCNKDAEDHALLPLNMVHAAWCPLTDQPLPSTPRDPSRAEQVCDCANQRCQDAYDLGLHDGLATAKHVMDVARELANTSSPVSAPQHFIERMNKLRAVLNGLHQLDRPRIVVLCGSTRFYEQYRMANYQESLAGHIVLSIGFYPRDDRPHWQDNGITVEQKAQLDALHMRKIELADEVLLIAPGGYIGESTTGELAYARRLGKPIRKWEPFMVIGVDLASGEDWTASYVVTRQERINARADEAVPGLGKLGQVVGEGESS